MDWGGDTSITGKPGEELSSVDSGNAAIKLSSLVAMGMIGFRHTSP